MNYKMSFALLWIGLAVGLVLFFVGAYLQISLLYWVGIVVALIGVIQTRTFYRCPACGGRFSSHGPLVKVCPHCGEEL